MAYELKLKKINNPSELEEGAKYLVTDIIFQHFIGTGTHIYVEGVERTIAISRRKVEVFKFHELLRVYKIEEVCS